MIKLVIYIVLGILLLVSGYALYVLLSFHRIDDNEELEVKSEQNVKEYENKIVPTDCILKILSYNIGFCAYLRDYSFFMDGGKYSRAYSRESVLKNLENITAVLKEQDADFNLIQEVDKKATRSWKVNQEEVIEQNFTNAYCAFSVNYDSPYLFYPFKNPHGKSLAGLLTISKYKIEAAIRRSLPMQTGLAKLIELDRCYSKTYLKAANGADFIIYHFHLSAYSTDPEISNKQLFMMYDDIREEYEKGAYIIAGGDFNKDLLIDSGKVFKSDGKKHSGTTAFPIETLPAFLKLFYPFDSKKLVATCRNAHEPYIKDSTYVQTIDGFLVSDNIEVLETDIIDTEFEFSDHNPIYLNFKLKGKI